MDIYGKQEYNYELPKLRGVVPLKFHPDRKNIRRRSLEWALSFPEYVHWATNIWGPGNHQAAENWMDYQLETYAAACYPHGNPTAVQAIGDFCIWFTLFDDHMTIRNGLPSAGATAVRDAFHRVIAVTSGNSSTIPAEDQIFEGMLRDSWKRMSDSAPAPAVNRLARAMRRIMESWVKEDRARAAGELLNFDSYLELRRLSIACDEMYRCCEIALGIDLSDTYDRYGEELSHLDKYFNDHCIFINDLYSFRKECAQSLQEANESGEGGEPVWDKLNSIAVLCRLEGHTLQEAVDKLSRLTEETERSFVCDRATFLEKHPDLPSDVHAYLTEVGHCFAANRFYHAHSPRYHGIGHSWDEEVSGTITLTPERTIFQRT